MELLIMINACKIASAERVSTNWGCGGVWYWWWWHLVLVLMELLIMINACKIASAERVS